MAAIAKESLSPLIKSSSVRRRSLELCLKLGTQLLSPTNSTTAATPLSSHTSPVFHHSGELPSQSDFKFDINNFKSTLSPAHYKRRASDSSWVTGSVLKVANLKESQNEKRRRSITPQHPSSHLAKSENLVKQRNNFACLNFDEDSDTDLDSIKSHDQGYNISVAFHVIPPTPKKEVKVLSSSVLPFPLLDKLAIEDEGCDEIDFKSQNEQMQHLMEWKCSARARYDIDERFIKFVTTHCNLVLDIDDLLGKGSFGTVIGGRSKGRKVAVKVLKTTNSQRKASIFGESNILNIPRHSHICQVLDILQCGPDIAFIIMEKMHKGNLLSLLNDSSFKMDCSKAINISKQIALGLIFCHRHGLLHLDVKPQNVLVDECECYKLSDFGSSKLVRDIKSCYKYSQLQGTVPYTAPELFKGLTPTDKCDVYSLAITMWQTLSREIPYQDENEHAVIFRVVAQGLRPTLHGVIGTKDVNESITNQYIQLYQEAWSNDSEKRPSVPELHKRLIKIQLGIKLYA